MVRNTTESQQQSDKRGSLVNRRSIMKMTGASMMASGLPLSGTALASHTEAYDDGAKTIIDSNGNSGCENEEFAEVHSSVSGPKTVDDNRSTINQGVSVPVGYQECETEYTKAIDDVEIHVEMVSNPADGTGFEFQNVDPYLQGDSADPKYSRWLQKAIDFAWDKMPWSVVIPSPADLVIDDSSGPSVSVNDKSFTVEWKDWKDTSEYGFGAEWEIDFFSHNGGTPTGEWEWKLTTSADIGVESTSSHDPGFHKKGDFSHEHNIVVTVED